MRSLRALTWLLVLLVLVPAGVLGWLGFQAADAWDAAVESQIRRELDDAEAEARRVGATALEEVGRALEEQTARLATRIHEEVPLATPREAFARYEGRAIRVEGVGGCGAPWILRVLALRLLDTDGGALEEFVVWPPDEHAMGGEVDAILDDLRREADRRQYGGAGTEAALAVWDAARERLPGQRLRATSDAEAALVELRAGRGADGLAHDLERRWPLSVLQRVGRPVMRLWLAAAAETPEPWLTRLADAAVADVALTAVERAEVERIAAAARGATTGSAPSGGPVAVLPPERVLRTAPVIGRVRLEVAYDLSSLCIAVRDRMRDLGAWGPVALTDVLPPRDGTWPLEHARTGVVEARDLTLAGPDGLDVRVLVRHPDVGDRLRDRDVRRRATFIGVSSLLALTVVGLGLVRRAVRRERDARRLRDDFIANVSHELRTPLTSVCLHAEILADEDPPADRRRELARVVKAEGGRLAALVDDLLDFAALEQGVRRVEPEPVDLARAVREAVAPYETLAAREGVALEVELPAGELEALADAHALARILANLLSNAWRHGRPSRDGAAGRIRICAFADERPTEGPTVEVRDDGPGIPSEERRQVFERFRRGRGSRRVEGTGLGLALGRDLARAMDGDLQLVEDAHETVFRVTLPSVPRGLSEEEVP